MINSPHTVILSEAKDLLFSAFPPEKSRFFFAALLRMTLRYNLFARRSNILLPSAGVPTVPAVPIVLLDFGLRCVTG